MKKLLVVLLLSLTVQAQTKQIVIGKWIYEGTDPTSGISLYKAIYNPPSKLLNFPLNIVNTTFYVKNTQASSGPYTTPKTWLGISDPSALASCATECIAIELQTQLTPDNSPITFTLSDGEQFTTYGIVTTVIGTLPGNTQLVTNQFAYITLQVVK